MQIRLSLPALLCFGATAALTGCPKSTDPAEEPPTIEAATPVPDVEGVVGVDPEGGKPVVEEAVEAPAATHLGTWTSPSCGDRAYVRELRFHPNGVFRGRDLVSPCPAGAVCVWSGIVDYAGTWSLAHGSLHMTYDAPPSTPQAPVSLPTALAFGDTGLQESDGCAYSRVESGSSPAP